MGDLCKLLADDERLNQLIELSKQTEEAGPPAGIAGKLVSICGYDRKNNQPRTMFYDARNASGALKELRPKFNGRLVVHQYLSPEYMCLTDTADGEPLTEKGKWVIAGIGTGGRVRQLFNTREEMIEGKDEVYKQIRGRAIVHQIGSTTYHIIDVELYLALQKEKT